MDHIQHYLDYFSAHPEWAIVIIFLIALGEALLIIGLFVPSTVVLVGAGTLVGTGHLAFWPVMLATTIGAIAGDQISYWAGRLFGDKLKGYWPLNRFPALVAKGEDFVRSHGGKSIAIGRFVPGVKAVVPGIVGMLGMSQPFFIFVNVTSGIVWGAAHVFPGMLIGQGLALAGEFSGRLAFLLLLLLVALGVLGWVIRLLSSGLFSPMIRRLMAVLSRLAKSQRSRPFYRLGMALSPDHPKAARIVSMVLALLVACSIAGYLLIRVGTLEAASNLDQSVFGLLQDLRDAPSDNLMVRLSMLGDTVALLALCAAMAIWLLFHRAWRTALGIVFAVAAQQAVIIGLKFAFQRSRPLDLPMEPYELVYGFPSGHAAFVMLGFGLLAVIAGHAMGRWAKALVYAAAGMTVFLVAFSRLYLGVHWMADVLAGIAISAVVIMAFGVALEAWPARRIRPLGLIGIALTTWLSVASLNIAINFDQREAAYALRVDVKTQDPITWSMTAWETLSPRRVDLSGQSGEPFVAQYIGPLAGLDAQQQALGYLAQPNWNWAAMLSYSDPHAPFQDVPPRPLLHEGLHAKFTAVKSDPSTPNERLVLRAFKTDSAVSVEGQDQPVFLISLLREENMPRFKLFTLPQSDPAPAEEVVRLLAGIKGKRLVEGIGDKAPVILANP